MSFDITLTPFGYEILTPTDEQIAEGANAVHIVVHFGTVLPIALGPGQQGIPVPLGVLRLPTAREQGLSLSEKLEEVCEKLPKESEIVTASSLEGIDKIADFQKGLRNNG